MNVKLISYSQPTEELKSLGIDDAQELIAFCARVSNPSNQLNTETSEKLIRYLINHKHWSPLECVSACVEVETTRDIARQILRHRSFSFQEFCITGDSKITCGWYNKDGAFVPNYIPISKLYERQSWNNYKDILVRVYDEDTKTFVTSKFKEVFKTGTKPVYRLTLSDGKVIECTKEHKFLSDNGWETLENISGMSSTKTGRITLKNPRQIAVNGDICYQNKNWLSDMKEKSLENKEGLKFIADSAGVSYHTIRKWLKKHGLQYSKSEVSSYTESWNKGKTGYRITGRTEEQKQYMRGITPKGEFHHAYKGGSRAYRASICNFFQPLRKEIFEKFNYTCQHCGKLFGERADKIEIHHIMEVATHPELAFDINNVIPMHKKCHRNHHNANFQFNAEVRKTHTGNTLVPRFVNIQSIEYIGEMETYDMEVEHHSHNYVANKICVHNSQRYADPTSDLSFEIREARYQDAKNRQNSLELDMTDEHDVELSKLWVIKQQDVIRLAKETYEWAVNNNIAKEVARAVLPEGNTVSRLYINGTLRSYIHFIDVRSDESTQLEHRIVAMACAKAIADIFPMVSDFVH